jgi:hypothetical protein
MTRESVTGMANDFLATVFYHQSISEMQSHGADNPYSDYRHHGNVTEKNIKCKGKREKTTKKH